MTTFFTSDTHFQHANILTLGAGRPFPSIEEHDSALIDNWNSVVTLNDTVYHLGDVAMGQHPTGLNKLQKCNGTKYLLPGNHDRVSSAQSPTRQDKFRQDYLDVFTHILDEVTTLQLENTEFLLSHYPYHGDSHDADRYTSLRPQDDGSTPLLHGHTHQLHRLTRSDKGTTMFSVGVDANDFTPISLDEIKTLIKEYTTK